MRTKLLALVVLASALSGCEYDEHHRKHRGKESHFIVVDERHEKKHEAHDKKREHKAHHRGLTDAEFAAKAKALQKRIDDNRRKLRRK